MKTLTYVLRLPEARQIMQGAALVPDRKLTERFGQEIDELLEDIEDPIITCFVHGGLLYVICRVQTETHTLPPSYIPKLS